MTRSSSKRVSNVRSEHGSLSEEGRNEGESSMSGVVVVQPIAPALDSCTWGSGESRGAISSAERHEKRRDVAETSVARMPVDRLRRAVSRTRVLSEGLRSTRRSQRVRYRG